MLKEGKIQINWMEFYQNVCFRPHLASFWRSGSGTETTSKQDSSPQEGSEPAEAQSSSKEELENAAAPGPAEDNKLEQENTKLQTALKAYEV